MPDENKFRELTAIGYRIQPSCGLCAYGRFPSDEWGTCDRYDYQHTKHSGLPRQLSVHKAGCCRIGFEPDPTETAKLGSFQNLLYTPKEILNRDLSLLELTLEIVKDLSKVREDQLPFHYSRRTSFGDQLRIDDNSCTLLKNKFEHEGWKVEIVQYPGNPNPKSNQDDYGPYTEIVFSH